MLADGSCHNTMGHRSPGMKHGSLLLLPWMPETSVKHETEYRLGQREDYHGYLRMLNKALLVFHLYPVPSVQHGKIIISSKVENMVWRLKTMLLSCPGRKVWPCVHVWTDGDMQEVPLQKERAHPFSFLFPSAGKAAVMQTPWWRGGCSE